jgi:hypothetical protein
VGLRFNTMPGHGRKPKSAIRRHAETLADILSAELDEARLQHGSAARTQLEKSWLAFSTFVLHLNDKPPDDMRRELFEASADRRVAALKQCFRSRSSKTAERRERALEAYKLLSQYLSQ